MQWDEPQYYFSIYYWVRLTRETRADYGHGQLPFAADALALSERLQGSYPENDQSDVPLVHRLTDEK
jgi:hypothetical protein